MRPLQAAGKRTRRVAIQRPTETRSSSGQATITYAVFERRWARVDSLSGNELVQAREVVPRASHRVYIEPIAGLTTRCRLVLREGEERSDRLLEVGRGVTPQPR